MGEAGLDDRKVSLSTESLVDLACKKCKPKERDFHCKRYKIMNRQNECPVNRRIRFGTQPR